jgi:hypothetical protein
MECNTHTLKETVAQPSKANLRKGKTNMNRGGFSWKRFVGISAAKSRISRSIGIPLTKSGRQRKIGKMVTGGGCLVTMIVGVTFPLILAIIVTNCF